jgi:hypothetical protein
MDAEKVVARFLEAREAFRYEPKESKKSKVNRLMRLILSHTGIGRRVAEDIADAIIRNRDLARLAIQKGWPLDRDIIEGPRGVFPVEAARAAI